MKEKVIIEIDPKIYNSLLKFLIMENLSALVDYIKSHSRLVEEKQIDVK